MSLTYYRLTYVGQPVEDNSRFYMYKDGELIKRIGVDSGKAEQGRLSFAGVFFNESYILKNTNESGYVVGNNLVKEILITKMSEDEWNKEVFMYLV